MKENPSPKDVRPARDNKTLDPFSSQSVLVSAINNPVEILDDKIVVTAACCEEKSYSVARWETMSPNFNIIVAWEGGDITSIDKGLEKLVTENNYVGERVDEGRDWVNWSFEGTLANDDLFHPEYMEVYYYLLGEGFEQSRLFWGGRRFAKGEED
ncbi:hypothetical protein NOR_06254 [Metarhizium rileyi]|uniref:Uncharacterized protein n=1 Tax=Metarhizium rileyi (strain RCEF 4871) TaxID=1649241 RepID=A0A167AX29_METRR|nr:hypothetical protein NOR_06254 [Metarhizium rileyi RCEF 4871]